MLPREKIEERKSALEAEQKRLRKEIEDAGKPVDFGNDVEDASEEADEAEEFSNRLAIAQAKKDELREIEAALQKMREGTYGKCDSCGGEISEKILAIAPESVLCAACKRTQ